MSNEAEILQHAKQLILAQNYGQAREVLQSISQNLTAQQWLAALDHIAPQSDLLPVDYPLVDSFSGNADQYPSVDYFPFPYEVPQKKRQMWNPIYGFLFVFTGCLIPFAPILFLWNWRRYGQTTWLAQTVILSILWVGGLFCSVVMWFVVYNDLASPRGIAMPVTGLVFFVAFWVGIGLTQHRIFRAEKRSVLVNVEIGHQRLFRRMAAWISIPAAIVALLIGAGFFVTSFEETFENEILRITYSYPNWDEVPLYETDYCATRDQLPCFLVLEQDPSEEILMIFSMSHLDETTDLVELDRFWWDLEMSSQNSRLVVRSYKTIVINGVSAIVREYYSSLRGNEYFMTVSMVYADQFLQIRIISTDREYFFDDRDKIMDVIEAIEFQHNQ